MTELIEGAAMTPTHRTRGRTLRTLTGVLLALAIVCLTPLAAHGYADVKGNDAGPSDGGPQVGGVEVNRPARGSRTLPLTGGDIVGLVVIGVALTATGTAVVTLNRRRSRQITA
jgi:hypothetical protein